VSVTEIERRVVRNLLARLNARKSRRKPETILVMLTLGGLCKDFETALKTKRGNGNI